MDDCELIKSSALIIQGEFLGTTKLISSEQTTDINPGVIQISATFKGQSIDVVLIKQPSVFRPISSGDTFFKKGQVGIWFLSIKNNSSYGLYLANHPQRFWTEDKASDLKALIKACLKSE
jgi:hypothetical protein